MDKSSDIYVFYNNIGKTPPRTCPSEFENLKIMPHDYLSNSITLLLKQKNNSGL